MAADRAARPEPAPRLELLAPPVGAADLRGLASLLVEAVDSGAAVSFLAPLPVDRAEAWWRRTIGEASPRALFFVAREGGETSGTVQLHPSWAPNQPHRGEIAKLLVRRGSRGRGLGALLMEAIEEEARRGGFTLLTLDAKRGSDAERLYRRLGWTAAGTIPGFALDPDGATPHDAVFFYKRLSP